MEYTNKQKIKIYWNYVPYYFYKLLRMEEYFLKKQEQIDALTKDLEDKKYTKLCFIDLIDAGATYKVDKYGSCLHIKKDAEPKEFREKSAYLIGLASIYDQINECIDKVKVQYEPFIEVKNLNKECIIVRVDTIDGRVEEEKRKAMSSGHSYGTTSWE